ncbi:MAG: hypothetical protein H6907_09765 [Hyphomicrobiales bacterium]|nr:hypothetical protein [Hyphomicrobiales bacterium]MCP5372005.1 hypothetical protein [Hyphomicrobiales bacterium]
MIEAILQAVQGLDLLPGGLAADYMVEVGKNVSLHMKDRRDGTELSVKTFFDDRGENEARALADAHRDLGDLVPAPLWAGWRGDMYLLVCATVPHAKLTRDLVPGRIGLVSDALRRLTAYSLARATADGMARGHGPYLRRLVDTLPSEDLRAGLARCLDRVDLSALDRLPLAPQHSDFVIYNLGLRTDSGGILIFDWEDYGRITTPGTDVTTFVSSCLGHDGAALAALRDRRAPADLAAIVDAGLAALGLSWDQYWTFAPLHVCAFIDLKVRLGYAQAVVRVLEKTAASLLAPSHGES